MSAIDTAPVHAVNEYWKWSPETRTEYKQWHAAKQRRQQAVQIPATVDEDEGEAGSEAAEGEEDVVEEAAVEVEAEDAKSKKEPSRWVQYQAIARAELIEETPGSKTKLVDVKDLARALTRGATN